MNAVHTFYMCSQKESWVKEDESKHHGTTNESLSEQENFHRTNITIASRKYGSHRIYIVVEVVGLFLWSGWQAARLLNGNLIVYGNFKFL